MRTKAYDVYAIKLTNENIPHIIEVTKPLGWTLEYLQDNLSCYAEDGYELMLFLKLFTGTTEIATFLDEPTDPSQDSSYRLTDKLDPKFGIFYEVETI